MLARACAAVAATLLLLPVAPASATWTNPFPVNSVNGDASSPAVGIDSTGKAIVAYREAGGGLFINTRLPDGTVGAPVAINSVPAGPPQLATNAAGASAVVWQESDGANSRLHLRLRRADGSMTASQTISQAGVDVFSPTVGIDGAGNAFAVWGANIGGVNRIFFRFKNATTNALTPVTPISAATGNNQDPRIAVEPGGRAFLAWRDFEADGQIVMGLSRNAGGTLSAPIPLSAAPGTTGAPAVAIDTAGTALVAWSKVIDFQRAQARTITSSGMLSPVTTLSSAGAPADEVDVSMASSGTTGVVGWRRALNGNLRMQIRRVVGGDWQPAETVSQTGADVNELRVRMSGNAGKITSLYSSQESATARVRARTRLADGTFGPFDVVSSENGLSAQTPRLAMNAAGRAAATWRQQQDDERGDLIWVGTNFID